MFKLIRIKFLLKALLLLFITERIICLKICHVSDQEYCKIKHDSVREGYIIVCEKTECEDDFR